MAPTYMGQLTRSASEMFNSAVTRVVFLWLDLLDVILCILFRFADEFFEGKAAPCFCHGGGEDMSRHGSVDDSSSVISETLYGRENFFRNMGAFKMPEEWDHDDDDSFNGDDLKRKGGMGILGNRWSDCGCESCVSWMGNVEQKLHVVVNKQVKFVEEVGVPRENVLFVHGFLSSSSFWKETVFPHLSASAEGKRYELFAVDLLGFGRSPKPRDCDYTLKDHIEMIEESVLCPYQLESFHLVAHSMGCIVALALAAKYPSHVRSVTLVAPPYFSSSEEDASFRAFRKLAVKTLWSPFMFLSAVMGWYEHIGRFLCFVVCRNHRTWEWLLKLITLQSKLPFWVMDATRHTHQSGWHSMHNVICGGAKLMDGCLETLRKSGTNICVIQGTRDTVVPVDCGKSIKTKVPQADIRILNDVDHLSVIMGREKEFSGELRDVWESVARG